MTKITIDVSEEDYKNALGDGPITEQAGYNVLANKVVFAYEADKNKIQVGDWVFAHNNSGIPIIAKVQELNNDGCSMDKKDTSTWKSYEQCKRLSQTLQDLLNQELK